MAFQNKVYIWLNIVVKVQQRINEMMYLNDGSGKSNRGKIIIQLLYQDLILLQSNEVLLVKKNDHDRVVIENDY